MDPWKRIRLWLCIGAVVALLAVGTYARLVWEGPPPYEPPYPPLKITSGDFPPRSIDPFVELQRYYRWPAQKDKVYFSDGRVLYGDGTPAPP